VENTNYLIHTSTGSYILTLYEKRVAEADLPFFLGLMEHLAGKGIPCPTPVHGKDGKALRRLCGRPAAIITFLDGMWPRRIRTEHCAGVGKALARLHMAGQDFAISRPNALTVDSWRPLLAASAPRADEVQQGLAAVLEKELGFLEASWPADLPSGICHADLFPDNVFFVGDKLSGLIDFYFACNDFFAYDLAVCLNAWCFERDRSFNITKARAMLSTYRQVRPFSDAELAALPLLARGCALRFLLTRLYDWLNTPAGALVKPKDPLEYLAILQFHQAVAGPGAYGLE
jgi:homoserine kinase type II